MRPRELICYQLTHIIRALNERELPEVRNRKRKMVSLDDEEEIFNKRKYSYFNVRRKVLSPKRAITRKPTLSGIITAKVSIHWYGDLFSLCTWYHLLF